MFRLSIQVKMYILFKNDFDVLDNRIVIYSRSITHYRYPRMCIEITSSGRISNQIRADFYFQA